MSVNPVTEALVLSAIAVVVTVVSHKIIKLYYGRSKLPPGPFPLPVAGNLLTFRKNMFAHDVMTDLGKEYGPVYTLFLGPLATVVITDPEIGLQVLKKHTFAGRPKPDFLDWFFREDSIDIVFADFGKEWEALRKVGHSAARKYAVSPQLSTTVTEVVDRIIDRVKEEPFDSNEQFSLTMIAILAQAAFGKKYELEDPEFLRWKEAIDVLQKTNRILMIIFFVPFLRHIFPGTWKEFVGTINYQRDYIEMMYKRALDNYTDGKNETFCDAMITAKKEAEAEENWMLPHLKPQNMYNAVSDLFGAGTDTTRMTLRWIFILLAKYPDMQEKMRQEVADVTQGETVATGRQGKVQLCLRLHQRVNEIQTHCSRRSRSQGDRRRRD